jgi:hypothetical protein
MLLPELSPPATDTPSVKDDAFNSDRIVKLINARKIEDFGKERCELLETLPSKFIPAIHPCIYSKRHYCRTPLNDRERYPDGKKSNL